MSFNGKSFCLITGASSGFGQALAQLITKEYSILHNAKPGSKILLISRNMHGLEETKNLMNQNGFSMERFDIVFLSVDLANITITEDKFERFLDGMSEDFKNVLIFNNAGCVGDISKKLLQSGSNMNVFQNYLNLSIVSPIFIIKACCNHFPKSQKIIIQTSSLCAIQPFPYMTMYCTGKASMDMFMKCLTLDHPSIITLNYAPGPLATAMGIKMKEKNGSEEIRNTFSEMFEKGTIIKPAVSALKLLKLLDKMDFESGSHIDYYDV